MSSSLKCSKLCALRKLLEQNKIDAYLLRTCDYHGSEFLADKDKRIAYISNFTGSNATIVVTLSKALLWTDGRYHDQASNQLSDEWSLMKDGLLDVPTVKQWLSKIAKDSKVGFDPRLLTIEEFDALNDAGINLHAINNNLIDEIWNTDPQNRRPQSSKSKLFILPNCGLSTKEKLCQIRSDLTEQQMLLINSLEEVAWVLNLRSDDVPYTPVFFSFLIISPECAHLYVDKEKLSPEVVAHLEESEVEVEDYEQIWNDIPEIPSEEILVPKSSSIAIKNIVGSKCVLLDRSPIAKLKASKNPTEQECFKKVHIKDAVAMCEFLYTLSKNPEKYDELSAEMLVDSLRAKQEGFITQSFHTISGYGPNGSIIHYNSSKTTNRPIGKDALYLVDSGGQYVDGTTDITRTLHFGNPTDYEKKCFTAVLKSHLALANSQFPVGTAASRLDSIARRPMWMMGMDYGHGTGHGVGFCLGVHEGPFSISTRILNTEPMCEGGVVSDEPGYYESGKFGIRIENLLICTPSKLFKNYLSFEYLTLVPISKALVNVDMLTNEEVEQLNEYHQQVRNTIIPELKRQNKDKDILDWVNEQTGPLHK